MKDSAIYSNLPVYRDCYAVMLEFAKMRTALPRDTRYTIAQDLSRALMDMMVTIYRANSSRADKARLIAELRRKAVEVQIHFRLGCGLPIGNLSSQLFSNIYLGAMDDFMKRELRCRHYGRYVDDAFVVGSSQGELYAIVPRVRDFLHDELELELNECKVRIVDAYKGVEFLGAYVKPYRTYPSTRSLRRMRGRMRSLDWREGPKQAQARVNSMLGVLSHYDCFLKRKALVWHGRLRDHGRVTEDCLRFYPDVLEYMARRRGYQI